MFFELVLAYIVYLLIILAGIYYVDLYLTKEQYTRDDLKNSFSYVTGVFQRVSNAYSLPMFFLILFVSSLLGLLIPMFTKNWLINSALLVVIVFFVIPFIKGNLERSQVTTSEDIMDTIINIFVRYDAVIVVGFGTGYGTILMYNWATVKAVHFLWFLINIVIISVVIGVTIKDALRQQ